MEGKGRCIDLTDLAGVGRGKQGALQLGSCHNTIMILLYPPRSTVVLHLMT